MGEVRTLLFGALFEGRVNSSAGLQWCVLANVLRNGVNAIVTHVPRSGAKEIANLLLEKKKNGRKLLSRALSRQSAVLLPTQCCSRRQELGAVHSRPCTTARGETLESSLGSGTKMDSLFLI